MVALQRRQDTLSGVKRVMRLPDGRFHDDKDSAVEWRDGEKVYFLEGIRFDYEIWKGLVDNTLDPRTALTLKNMTQRRFAIKRIGYAEIVEKLGFKEIKSEGDYHLWVGHLDDDDNRAAYIMQMKCPSTKMDYYIRVPPVVDWTIHDYIAWTFGFENRPIKNEAVLYQPEKET